eukprot:6912464-Lingulodinium_polyedra.AAC.1
MVARALTHPFLRCIFPASSKAEKAAARLVQRMKRLAATKPEKATGTSQWLAGVLACLRTQPVEE